MTIPRAVIGEYVPTGGDGPTIIAMLLLRVLKLVLKFASSIYTTTKSKP